MSAPEPASVTIAPVGEPDLPDLLRLLRAYCDFYETAPSDAALQDLSHTLLADPRREGVQLIARDTRSVAVGFATVFWSWDTTEAVRVGIMNDLYVSPQARGSGLADALISACMERCALAGAARLDWVTGPANTRAQAVYDRFGAKREPWLSYSIEVANGRRTAVADERS